MYYGYTYNCVANKQQLPLTILIPLLYVARNVSDILPYRLTCPLNLFSYSADDTETEMRTLSTLIIYN